MQPTPRARRTTKALARIAEITERRAHVDVLSAQRTLDHQAALRSELSDAQREDEAAFWSTDEPVHAGVVQLVSAARIAHSQRMDALDQAIDDTQELLNQRRHAHLGAIERKRSASKVADHVRAARARELLQKVQKQDDDLSSARYGHAQVRTRQEVGTNGQRTRQPLPTPAELAP
ncbi:MAG: hypothetical protein QF464_04785 [Myxococcota bacterium]|jgi:paraquat-inducible protein B|nr:hypothetical protein [Myxococcota bacterium]